MKVLLAGEGPTDHGSENRTGKRMVWDEGACQPILRKCAGGKELIFEVIVPSKWKAVPTFQERRRRPRALPGHAKKAWACYALAVLGECQVAVVLVDCDRRSLEEIRNELQQGFERAKSKINGDIPTVRMVPLKTIESWLLSDENAFETVTGVPLTGRQRISHPEDLWGDPSDPESNHPKAKLNRMLRGSRLSANPETYALIAEQINLDTLILRCPDSAAPFVEEAKEAFSD